MPAFLASETVAVSPADKPPAKPRIEVAVSESPAGNALPMPPGTEQKSKATLTALVDHVSQSKSLSPSEEFELGHKLLEEGKRVQALAAFTRAAQAGCLEANLECGIIHVQETNHTEAEKWLKKAAKVGDLRAYTWLEAVRVCAKAARKRIEKEPGPPPQEVVLGEMTVPPTLTGLSATQPDQNQKLNPSEEFELERKQGSAVPTVDMRALQAIMSERARRTRLVWLGVLIGGGVLLILTKGNILAAVLIGFLLFILIGIGVEIAQKLYGTEIGIKESLVGVAIVVVCMILIGKGCNTGPVEDFDAGDSWHRP